MDHSKLKKPDHVKDHIWQQRLDWMEVVGKQMEENLRQRRKQAEHESGKKSRG